MRVGLLALGVAAVALTGCTPTDSDIVGRWESADGAVIEFAADRTFSASGIDVISLYDRDDPGLSDAPLYGDWVPQSWAENPFREGNAVSILWRSATVYYVGDDFQLLDGGGENADRLVINDWIGREPVPFVEFVRVDDRLPFER